MFVIVAKARILILQTMNNYYVKIVVAKILEQNFHKIYFNKRKKMKNIFESKKEDFEIKEYKFKIKNINDNDGHFYFNAKTKKIMNLNKKKGKK